MALNIAIDSFDIVSNIKNVHRLNDTLKYLYKNYYGLLEKYVLNNNGNKEDAEDVIQDTMVAFIDIVQMEKYRGEAEIGTFLYSIARNIWLAKIRKTNAEYNRNEIWNGQSEETEKDISNQIEKQEALQFVEKLFDTLGVTCKKILTLFYFEEASMKNILEQVNFENEQVVRNKKAKCMKALTETIEIKPKLGEYLKKALQNLNNGNH